MPFCPFRQQFITSFFQSKSHKMPLGRHCEHSSSVNEWPTMLFLQVVKVYARDVMRIRVVERAVSAGQSTDPDYVVQFCLPSDKYNARGFL